MEYLMIALACFMIMASGAIYEAMKESSPDVSKWAGVASVMASSSAFVPAGALSEMLKYDYSRGDGLPILAISILSFFGMNWFLKRIKFLHPGKWPSGVFIICGIIVAAGWWASPLT